MAVKRTSSVDLLMVLDEKDYIQKRANEVQMEFTFLKKPITTRTCRMMDQDDDANSSLKCKKVVFFTDKDTQSLQLRVTDWLKKLGKLNKTNDYLIVNRQADADSNEPVEEIAMARVVNVPSLDMVALWWPECLQLSFGTKKSKKKLLWSRNLSPNSPESSRMFENFRFTAMERLGQTDDMEKADCIILIAENGEPDIDESFKEIVREAKINKIPVHFIMYRGEAISFDIKWITTATHFPDRPLRAIFWILDDLKFVKVRFGDRTKPETVPKPCKPVMWITGGDDWVALLWSTKEPEDVGESAIKHFTIESRIVHACSATDWKFYQRQSYDGSGATAVKYEELYSGMRYQFRISSENVNGRSKGLVTPDMEPGALWASEEVPNGMLVRYVGCVVALQVLIVLVSIGQLVASILK